MTPQQHDRLLQEEKADTAGEKYVSSKPLHHSDTKSIATDQHFDYQILPFD